MSTEKFSTMMNELKKYEDSDKIALICGEEKLTYKQLIADSKHIARGLVAEGVKKGDRILFCMSRTANAIRALLGILYAGGVYVAADPEWPEERLKFVCKDANTVFSMTDETCKSLREKESSSVELPVVNGEDEAAIYYTSGSTGQPKGAVLHHIVICSPRSLEFFNTEGHSITVQSNYKFMFVASGSDFFDSFYNGKTLVLAREKEQFSPELLAISIKQHRVDVVCSTPSIILKYLENPVFAKEFYELKQVLLGGEKLLPSIIEKISKATKAKLIIGYGSSEMFNCAAYCYQNDRKVYLGKPSAHDVRLYLLNENLEEVERGQDGELFIGGTPAKYGHYLNRPDLDKEKYIEHKSYGRLFRTGDYARLEMNGEITMLGRMDGMVKLHGQRIEIGEVENAMEKFPGVRRAAVTIQKISGQEALCGFYTAEREIEDRAFRKYLSKLLPLYMIPAFLRRLPEMPENANGKLNYRALPLIEIEKDKPVISILTPVHNASMEFLTRAHRSVTAQDYDHEKIEWFVAVHNMDSDYFKKVQETLGESPHIHIFALNEPTRTIAAVRNVLLEHATGRYLFWLDQDDELKPSCVSRAVELMEQKHADMLLFPCEEIEDGKGCVELRKLNIVADEPVVYDKGDPQLGNLMAGCAPEIWCWCIAISLVREAKIHFDEECIDCCEPVFSSNIISFAKRVVVIPREKNYVYHIHYESTFQRGREASNAYHTCTKHIFGLKKALDNANKDSFDLNLFTWFWFNNICSNFSKSYIEANQKQEIREALLPVVKNLRVLAPCPVFPPEGANMLTKYIALIFPDVAMNFKNPRWEHKRVTLSYHPSPDEIIAKIHALDYVGFKTLPDDENIFLGRVDEAAAPEVITVDLRGHTQKQNALIKGYQHTEELRGFEAHEVPFRVTLFYLNDTQCEVLITWDGRFLHESASEWLLQHIILSQ